MALSLPDHRRPVHASGEFWRPADANYAYRRTNRGVQPCTRAVSYSSQLMTTCHYSPDRKSTRLNSSHSQISYAVFCLKKKNIDQSQKDVGQRGNQFVDQTWACKRT